MEENTIAPIKYVIIAVLAVIVLVGFVFMPFINTTAQSRSIVGRANQRTIGFSDSITANTLCSAGLDECANPGSGKSSGGFFSALFGGGSAGGKIGDPILTVVNVPGYSAVYRIVEGKRHAVPTSEIFYSYGLTLDMVQEISLDELFKYPIARLFIVEGDETQTIYYLTEGGMIRPILNDEVFYSYGNRKEDVITINQKEFNYYPRNQFVFVEKPQIIRDVYQITGGIKRYLTPAAVKSMNLLENEIAPVNQIELDAYPEGEPVIF